MWIGEVTSQSFLAGTSFKTCPATVLIMAGIVVAMWIVILVMLTIAGCHDSAGSLSHLILLLFEQRSPIVDVVLLVTHRVE